ncbi:MAG: DEAD/DEAH box helicase family protein [Legionella sp.]|nr:DEAD/DEAH box helicase family protein [Legionella sp.]
MPQYLIPTALDTLERNCPDAAHWPLILKKINAVTSGEIVLEKKHFALKTVYTCDANYGRHFHRLVFERVDETSQYVLRSIAWNHDYDKALKFSPFTAEMSSLFTVRANDIEEVNEEAGTPLVSYNNCWYELTSIQSDILKCTTFPQLIIGPPGSGKTLTALAFFQERVLQKLQEGNDEPLRLLYLTGNTVLKDSVARSWENWIHSSFGTTPPRQIHVVFSTFEDQVRASLNANQRLLSHEDAIERIRALIKNTSCTLTAEEVFAEFLINAHVLMNDLSGSVQRAFAQSNYSKIGINKSSLDPKHLERVYHLFAQVHAQINETQECIVGISILAAQDEENQFDSTVVDEAQNNPLTDSVNALHRTKNKQILFLGDSLQKGAIKVSSLPLLGPALHEQGIKLTTHQLPGTHRLKPAVAAVANDLVSLYTYIKGGLVDSTSYSSLSAHAAGSQGDNSLNWVARCTDEYHRLGKNARAAALIFDECDREVAKKLIASQNVFTIEEAQGLEFSDLFLYVSAETMSSFLPISTAMKKHGINHETVLGEKKHLSAQKGIIDGEHLEHLSRFYVALSRTFGNAWVYIEPLENQQAHRHSPFLSWLKSKFMQKETLPLNVQTSSLEEWLTTIHAFIDQKKFAQAQSNLMLHFNFSAQEAEQYLHCSINQRYQSVGELHKRKQVDQSTSSSSAMQAKQGAMEAEPPASSLAPAFSSAPATTPTKVVLTSLKTDPKTKEPKEKTVKILSAKKAEWVEALLNNLSIKNIDLLLGAPNATAILFYHKMANGQCLFINLCNKGTYLSELSLNHLIKNLDKQPPEAVIHCFTESTLDILLSVAKWSLIKSKLNIKISEWFAPSDVGSLFYRLSTTSIGLNFLDANWSDIRAHFDTEGLFAPITSEGPLKGTTPFAGFSDSLKGLAFLDRHWKDFKPHLSTKGLFTILISGTHKGCTAFQLLFAHPNGEYFLDRHWDDIKKHMTKEGLFTPVIGADLTGMTPFLALCSLPEAQSFMGKHWSDFKKHLTKEDLFTKISSSGFQPGLTPFIALCVNIIDYPLLSVHWDDFKEYMNAENLFTPVGNYGPQRLISPFRLLCQSAQGRRLIATHWESTFSAFITENHIKNDPDGKQLKELIESYPSGKKRRTIGFFTPQISESNEPSAASSSFVSAASTA